MTIREARPEDASGIARVHVETWRTTYPGIMPQEHLDTLSVPDHEQMWRDRLEHTHGGWTYVYVAVIDTGEIVGFASGGRVRTEDTEYQGEVYALYVLQAQQRQGMGRMLVQTLARRLSGEGLPTLLIWVNAHNSACRFYEVLGGVHARTGQREIRGVTYDDIGYGWDAAALEKLLGETR